MCGGGGVDLPCIKVRKQGFVKDRKRKIKKERDWVKAKYRERNGKNGYQGEKGRFSEGGLTVEVVSRKKEK